MSVEAAFSNSPRGSRGEITIKPMLTIYVYEYIQVILNIDGYCCVI